MQRDFNEIVEYEVKKLTNAVAEGDIKAPRTFFNIAIGIQNSSGSYVPGYLARKKEIACEVLATIGFCDRGCSVCALEGAHEKAILEIEEGLRAPSKAKKKAEIKKEAKPAIERNPVEPKYKWIDKRIERLLDKMNQNSGKDK